MIPNQWKPKDSQQEAATLILNKVDFKSKIVTRNK